MPGSRDERSKAAGQGEQGRGGQGRAAGQRCHVVASLRFEFTQAPQTRSKHAHSSCSACRHWRRPECMLSVGGKSRLGEAISPRIISNARARLGRYGSNACSNGSRPCTTRRWHLRRFLAAVDSQVQAPAQATARARTPENGGLTLITPLSPGSTAPTSAGGLAPAGDQLTSAPGLAPPAAAPSWPPPKPAAEPY